MFEVGGRVSLPKIGLIPLELMMQVGCVLVLEFG
jgi:hypothetical protein